MKQFIDAGKLMAGTSILDFLGRLGHHPVRQSGGEHFFLSMLREERTASLTVNDGLGVWFDHGGPNGSGIRGGNLVDLAISYWHPVSYFEALGKIVQTIGGKIPDPGPSNARPRRPVRLPNYKIESIGPLGNNYAITSYLQNRGIWGMADGHLSELYYFVLDDKGTRKDFFAAGWPNENEGWEVRNKYFQGCLGHKGLSFIQGNPDELVVFEGYMDFLSWKFENEEAAPSVLVLNSLSLLPAGINRARKFEYIETYFDLDKAGIKASCDFRAALPMAKDCSKVYQGFKDYNEKLMSELSAMRTSNNIAAQIDVAKNSYQMRR